MRYGLITIVVLGHLFGTIQAKAEELPLSSDPLLTRALTGFYVLAELGGAYDTKTHFYLKVIGIAADGECGGKPESCPKGQAIIALAGDGEYPERRVYFLPEAFGWKFGEWEKNPRKFTSQADFVQFTMRRKVVGPDPTKEWWAEERYRVRVNFDSASLERLEAN